MLEARLEHYRALVEKELQALLNDERIPPVLKESMGYGVLFGGKRLRPCLALAACEMVNENAMPALPFACAVEMIHSYSLIHDDLPAMDDDDFRRGKPANHKVFGEGIAILAGDGLLSYAFQILLDACLKEPRLILAAKAIADGAGVWGMVAGQAADLLSEQNPVVDEGDLAYIQANKTGALLKASILSGAIVGRANEKTQALLAEFADCYGRLFQITDDILDVGGSFSKLGKTPGKDKAQGKLTAIELYGLNGAKQKAQIEAERAKRILKKIEFDASFFDALVDYTVLREK